MERLEKEVLRRTRMSRIKTPSSAATWVADWAKGRLPKLVISRENEWKQEVGCPARPPHRRRSTEWLVVPKTFG